MLHEEVKLFPVPCTCLEYYDYKYIRYYKTRTGYFRTYRVNQYFYTSVQNGLVEKISKREYTDNYQFSKQSSLVQTLKENLNKGVQLTLF